MWKILEHRSIDRKIKKSPKDVQEKYEKWLDIIYQSGPTGLRLIRGFNDEALQGEWKGFRSSRLSKQYREDGIATTANPDPSSCSTDSSDITTSKKDGHSEMCESSRAKTRGLLAKGYEARRRLRIRSGAAPEKVGNYLRWYKEAPLLRGAIQVRGSGKIFQAIALHATPSP